MGYISKQAVFPLPDTLILRDPYLCVSTSKGAICMLVRPHWCGTLQLANEDIAFNILKPVLKGGPPLSAESTLPSFNKNWPKKESSWDVSKSCSLYKIDCWGSPYFSVSATGTMVVCPHGHNTKPNEEIDIMKVLKMVKGLSTPAIFRFPDVLRDRLHRLQSSFDNAIKAQGYQGCFRGVFPVKCNQDKFVVEHIVESGKPYGFGLEVGSKPELLLAMTSLCKLGSPHALLVCNGYKDAHYVHLALMAKQIGLNCVIVLEQEEELDLVLSLGKKLSIDPVVGLRAKLNTKHAGYFGDTSGENSKFGLCCSQIVSIVNKLRQANKLGCMQLLHFHLGSQIPSLAILNDGVSEAAHIYCELALMGANMKFLDIGGGLGIDYDGTQSAHSHMSVGYTMEEYALQVVKAVNNACTIKGVKQPTLCSESGRALVSHHSVLVFDVLSSSVKNTHMPKGASLEVDCLPRDMKHIHSDLMDYARACDYQSALECAMLLKHNCIELFKNGKFGLSQLAAVNTIYDVVCASVDGSKKECGNYSNSEYMSGCNSFNSHGSDDEEGDCEQIHNAIYRINLSIFKSMPDTWAIGQLFPIVPLHRLEEEPKVRAILSDLTCDSDGVVATFVGKDKKGRTVNYMKVHELEEGKPYYMGMFLGGAYQEALGGLHNLFGSPSVVNIVCENGQMNAFTVSKASSGQTSSDVLRLMQYEPSTMLECLKIHIQNIVHDDDGNDNDGSGLVHALSHSFVSSTYLSTYNNLLH